MIKDMERSALLGPGRTHRYRFARWWGEGERVTFVMLNPSDGDELVEDRTLNRCIDFADTWGYGGIEVVILYAYRTPYPRVLHRAHDPVGPDNDRHLAEAVAAGGLVIAAWGNKAHRRRVRQVLALPGFDRLHVLKVNAKGDPAHPLYLPKTLVPVPWDRSLKSYP